MKKRFLLFVTLFMLPSLVLASTDFNTDFPLGFAIGLEAFVSIHMSIFVLKPLSDIFSKNGNSIKLFLILFCIRVAILLYFDFFVTTMIAIADFLAVFIGAFIIVPICSALTKKTINSESDQIIKPESTEEFSKNVILKCTKCGSELTIKHKFCENCGAPFDGNNVKVEVDPNAPIISSTKTTFVVPSQYDSMFSLTEDQMIEEFINRELIKAQMDKNTYAIPTAALKRKNTLNIIFSLLVFIYVGLIFFHFPIATYLIGLIVLIVSFILTRKYTLIKHLKKQLKARPNEKVSNIVMTAKSTLVPDTSGRFLMIGIIVAIILPMIIFIKPRIMYEKMEGGYGVRFYTFGITNFTTATIPEKYKNENVISLRGNTFSNMPFLNEVTLPDTIIEIRGQAFKNDRNLVKVNIPSNLNYLGGGAFYNCSSLTSIEIPDTVTYMGGEIFYNARSLKNVKLSENITEIRGSSFENCSSLEHTVIPDRVTRIGGHAFYGNSSLSKVVISINSQLTEIGSSAFRMCDNLYEVTLPYGVYVNERAFKESPTRINYYNYQCNGYNCNY